MNDIDVAALREILLEAPEPASTRLVALVGSLALVAAVLWLVRRGSLREEYTPIWLAVAAGVFLVSVNLDVLRVATRWIGAWSPSSTLFFFGELFLLAICLNYAVRLSRMSVQLKNLAQELALLRTELEAGRRP